MTFSMSFKKLMIIILGFVVLFIAFTLPPIIKVRHNGATLVMGAEIVSKADVHKELSKTTFNRGNRQIDEERFHRPSNQPSYKLKYTFSEPDSTSGQPPFIPKGYPKIYEKSEDVVEAYYSILKAASNMNGYQGGCGTVNWSTIPYPYAYELLCSELKGMMTLQQFERSFEGIGYINLLKLIPAYAPPNTPENVKFYMVEVEVINGVPAVPGMDETRQPSLFTYFYGLIATQYEEGQGWKIRYVNYIAEDFLCAPWHLWSWDSEAVVQIVYKEWYKLIDDIKKVDINYPYVTIYAKGKEGEYRFDFVRLTNGEDLLLHENVKKNGQWVEKNLLREEHQYLKHSILSPYFGN